MKPLLRVSLIISISLLCSCAGIRVDRGPFPIVEDEISVEGKKRYLDSIAVSPQTGSFPNILWILVDDLGLNDISTYRPEGVPMPALDRMAKSGVRFTAAYSTSAVCSPSRAGLLTGRYQQRFGFERQPMNRYPHGRLEYWLVDRLISTTPMELVEPMSNPGRKEICRQGIPAGEILLPEILNGRGYRTGIIGKWHLGHHDPFLPTQRGFDVQYGFYEAFTRYVPPGTPGIVESRGEYFADRHIWRKKRKGTCAIRENEEIIRDDEYLTFSIARRACDFIRMNLGEPFFLYLPFNAPHTPFQAPVEYYNRFGHVKDHTRRVYCGMLAALDDAVGRILDCLDSCGIAENTLVIFTSDNGGATYTGATDNGTLKAGKFAQFEGGIRVPMIISWERVLPGGTIYHHPVSLTDLFATSLAAAGCSLPADRPIDGVDLVPYLLGKNHGLPHPVLFWRTDFNKTVREGQWKMVWNVRDDQVFLYDLELDPDETRNLWEDYPERVVSLQEKITDWEKEMKAPLWPGVMQFIFDIDGEITRWAI